MTTPEHLILIVDDEADIRSMVAQALGRLSGYRIHEASSLADALGLLDRHTFDLVLTDLSMEHPNAGVELLQAVKQRAPDTIVILLTGYATLESAIAALRLGAENYLMKPSSVRELRENVVSALERRAETIRQRELLANIATTLQALSSPIGVSPRPAEPALPSPAPVDAGRYLTIGRL